ncbi:MAG: ATP-binding protein [Pseudanabaenaceae cyanobacterium bins.68]|nr:ATP-binding protein [Pseudanabaenaceae cyanobacterium bins.68]
MSDHQLEIERLRSQIAQLEAEKTDLELTIENVTEHADSIEAQLFLVNRQLKAEIRDRQEKETALRVSEALLRAINKSLQREKSDLELILETTTQHGDLMENILYAQGQQEQQELFHRITEALPDGILLARLPDWIILYANSAAIALLDLPGNQIIGSSWEVFCQTHDDFKHLQRHLEAEGQIQNQEICLHQKFETNLWVNLSLHRFSLDSQELLLLSCQDISARYQAQLALQRSQAELKRHSELLELRVQERTAALQAAVETAAQANRSKSIFLANVSHELRTPLNAILGYAQFLQQDQKLDPDQRASVGIIYQSSEHLLSLINDVLEISKIEAGRASLNEQIFDLAEELQAIVAMLGLRAEAKGIELRLEIGEDLPRLVVGDRGKLSQVLINLLSNGIKFTQAGNVTLRVYAESQPNVYQAHLGFEVSDTGKGISAEEISLLFQEFSQTESGRQLQEGTGLGLAISQKFVQMMGGEVRVSSIVDKGSVFWFDLRLAIAPHHLTDSALNQSYSQLDDQDLPPLRLLLAEDNAVNLKIALRMLSNLNYAVDHFANGADALAAHLAQPYDLILMDVQMPELDGLEATRAIRRWEQKNRIETQVVIIAMTAFGLAEDRQDCLAAGMNDYISKPVRQTELARILRHWQKIVKLNTKNLEAL